VPKAALGLTLQLSSWAAIAFASIGLNRRHALSGTNHLRLLGGRRRQGHAAADEVAVVDQPSVDLAGGLRRVRFAAAAVPPVAKLPAHIPDEQSRPPRSRSVMH
jgi:hypothetical protein